MIRNCDYCASPYEPKRKSSRYCSAACRVNFNNLPVKLSNYADSAEIVIARMMELVDRYPHLATQFTELSERMQSKAKASAKAIADRHPIQRKLSPPPPAPAKRKAPAAPKQQSATVPAPLQLLYEIEYRWAAYKKDGSGDLDNDTKTGKLRVKSSYRGERLRMALEIEIARKIQGAGLFIDYRVRQVQAPS